MGWDLFCEGLLGSGSVTVGQVTQVKQTTPTSYKLSQMSWSSALRCHPSGTQMEEQALFETLLALQKREKRKWQQLRWLLKFHLENAPVTSAHVSWAKAFFFGFLHSLGQKVSIFCSLFIIFLTTCFCRAIHSHLCCRTWGLVTRCCILGICVIGFLPSLLRGFLTGRHHLLWKIEKSEDSARSLGAQVMRPSSISESRNIANLLATRQGYIILYREKYWIYGIITEPMISRYW